MKTLKRMAIAAASLMPSAAIADSIQNFFTSAGDQCGSRTYIVEWSVTGDTTGDVVIKRFLRREDRGRSSFEGLTWRYPAADVSGTIIANGSNNRPLYEFTDMLSDNPSVVPLDRRGNPRTDCSFTLKAALPPSERFDATIAALNIAEPTADDGRLVNDLLMHLPPAAMLSTLAQTSTENDVQNAIRPFWDRYEANVLARASQTDDARVLPGVTEFWTEQTTRDLSRFHGKLLLQAQSIRAIAMRQQGKDPSQLAVHDGGALCARIDGVNARWNWDDYLELATGLPLEYWNEALAEDFLASSASCKKVDTFQKVVSQRWPEVQTRISAFNDVLAERDRIADLEISLEAMVAENWLTLDRNRLNTWRRAGIAQDDVLDIISPALDTQKQAAIAQLPRALGDEARTQTIALEKISGWCDKRRNELGYAYNNDLQETVFEACHAELAQILRDQALKVIETRQTQLLEAPETIETLVATDGYSFDKVIPRLWSSNPHFEKALAQIDTALASAQHKTEAQYRTVLNAAMESTSAAYASADPLGETAEAATKMCAPFTGFASPQRLRPMRNLCQNLNRDLQDRRRKAECDKTWSAMDVPENIQSGYLSVPQLLGGPKPVNIRDMVCDSNRDRVNVWIAEDSGWFSSDFRLHREAKIRTQTVEVSVRLNEPEAGAAEWTVDDPTISSGAFDLNETATSEDIMGCFYFPDLCYQP